MRLLIAGAVLLALPISTLAQASGSLTTDATYEKSCAKCHGKTAEGRHFGGPSLVRNTLSQDELKAVIANGKGRMPKFAGKLSPEQIATLATEIKAFSTSPPEK